MSQHQDLLRRAMTAIDELEAKLEAEKARSREPVAVVGMSCRFPGADSTASFWQLLAEARDAIGPFPDRIGGSSDDPTPWKGGFVDGVDLFDPAFFGISPREAATMDPQQRLVLEGAWLALEDAGVPPSTLVGSSSGVFVGITTSDYGQLTRGVGDDVYLATGAALNAASGRVSYVLGLQGPCMSIDTACSSSLVAMHAACQSLRVGDCDLALASGVNVLLMPDSFELFSRWGMLASDGRCKTFDAAADGFTRGEGCGVLVLKRLRDAEMDGDRIRAVILGSAVNQDGASSGLSVPNGPAQEKVLRRALAVSGITPADVDYVEAHGTGTILGDPIEVEALAAVYGRGRAPDRPLRIGSVKTNFGHLESASGVAGVCKTILSLENEAIPAHLHFREPNPRIAWAGLPLEVPVALTPWPRGERPRRAGVSSFGFTGTNAHVVLQEAPQRPPASPAWRASHHALPVSGRSSAALKANAQRYADAVSKAGSAALAELSRTAGAGRSHFAHRAAVVAATPDEAAEGLSRMAHTQDEVPARKAPRIAFLFSGQGAQRPGMGRDLYESSPVFRESLDRCASVCQDRMRIPLLDALFGSDPETLRDTEITQPALFAFEYALSTLWTSWGVRPVAVLGHSLGEYVAACVAGAMELEDALSLVVERGRLMSGLPSGGAMAAVFASADRVRPSAAAYADVLSIAAVNGPDGCVVSGRAEAVEDLCGKLAADGVETRALSVSHAFHSPLMDPILGPLEELVARAPVRPLRIPLATNVDGSLFAKGRVLDAAYWRRQAREAVQFEAAVRAVRDAGCDTLVEIGPASTLLSLARRALGSEGWNAIPSSGTDGEWKALVSALARTYELGAPVHWSTVTGPYADRMAPLPGYAFDRRRFWVDTKVRRASHDFARGQHPLLGAAMDVAGDAVRIWTSEIDLERLPYLDDHRVQGTVIVPATAYFEAGLAAAAQVLGDGPVRMSGLVNEKPLILRPDERRLLQTTLTRQEGERWGFEVHSRDPSGDGSSWVRHVHGQLSADPGSASEAPFDVEAVRGRCPEHLTGTDFYDRLARKGNQWGPTFQSTVEIWKGDGEAISRVEAAPALADELTTYRFHPALADSAGHVMVALQSLDATASATGGALVGGGAEEVRLHRVPEGARLWAHATARPSAGADNVVTGDVRVYDEDGELVSETLGAKLWYLRESDLSTDSLFFEVAWRSAGPVPPCDPEAWSESWCILADDTGVAEALVDTLRAAGRSVVVVRPGSGTTEAEMRIDPLADEDWNRVVSALGPDDASDTTIVDLWGLNGPLCRPAGAPRRTGDGHPRRRDPGARGVRPWRAVVGRDRGRATRSGSTRHGPRGSAAVGFRPGAVRRAPRAVGWPRRPRSRRAGHSVRQRPARDHRLGRHRERMRRSRRRPRGASAALDRAARGAPRSPSARRRARLRRSGGHRSRAGEAPCRGRVLEPGPRRTPHPSRWRRRPMERRTRGRRATPR